MHEALALVDLSANWRNESVATSLLVTGRSNIHMAPIGCLNGLVDGKRSEWAGLQMRTGRRRGGRRWPASRDWPTGTGQTRLVVKRWLGRVAMLPFAWLD